jgi:T5SS/PEP-CTERM-associated repeat protein
LSVGVGASADSAAASLGIGASGVGNVDVSKGQWSVGGALIVGGGGTGSLTVESGGLVSSGQGQIGTVAGSTGTATVTGTGSQWSAGIITIGGGGFGALKVTDGGTVVASQIVIGAGGSLGGDGGTMSANVVNQGGLVRPGDAPGLLRISGDYTQSSGTLLFEIDGTQPGQFDQLLVSGQALFTGGTIDIEFGGGFLPQEGDVFDLMAALLGLSNQGVNVEVLGLPAGMDFTETFTDHGLSVVFTGEGGGGEVGGGTNVPEPPVLALLCAALTLLLFASRRSAVRSNA